MADTTVATRPTQGQHKPRGVLRGKRTGVIVDINAGNDDDDDKSDLDTFWKAVKSPQQVPEEKSHPPETPKPQQTKKIVPPRFSIDGAPQDDDEQSIKSSNYVTRVVSNKTGRKVAFSPSELSSVSTAPPTPNPVVTQPTQDDATKHETRVIPSPEEDADVPRGLPQAAARPSSPTVAMEDPISPAAFPEADEEVSVQSDGDDLCPPPPPPEDNQEEVDVEPVREDGPTESPDQVEFPSVDDDMDDDDKEGPGFNIVEDPETPESVREARREEEEARKKEQKELEREERRKRKEEKERQRRKKEEEEERRRRELAESDTDDMPQDDDSEQVHTSPEADDATSKTTTRRKKKSQVVAYKTPKKTVESGNTEKKNQKKKKKVQYHSPPGYQAGNREYQAVPVSDLKESPEEKGLRRSRRARYAPLAFWKNERAVYGAHSESGSLGDAMGDMPVVKGVLTALPTPYKKRKAIEQTAKPKRNLRSKTENDDDDAPFDSRKLRKKYHINDGEIANVWDDGAGEAVDLKVICYESNMVATELPMPRTRKRGEGKVVGRAAQAFNIPSRAGESYPGYIMGNLSLPPKGIKDAECVGPCAQTFTVCAGQPKALEVCLGIPDDPEGEIDPDTAQRYLLSPGDMFLVPPANNYRLQNHSKTTDSFLTWTIIRPTLGQQVSP